MPPRKKRKTMTRATPNTSKARKSVSVKDDHTNHVIVEIFKEAQLHASSHDRLSVQLKSIYKSMPFDDFWEDFLECTRYPMVVMEQSVYVDRIMSFIVNFALFLCRGDEDGASVENFDQDSAILLHLLEFCCEYHDAAKPAVRYRCVQFMRKMLAGLGHEATISDKLFFTIQSQLLNRAWDVKAIIRAEAANALSRMQDPVNRDCPIITTLLHLLKHDPNVEVRKAALVSIAITTKTLPAIIERCQDVSDVVRKKAYSILKSKSLLKPLSIAKRLRLLQDGLNDPSQSVKEECIAMLQRWFELCDKDPLILLKRLDVEGSREITEQAINVLLNSQSTEMILQSVSLLLNDELVLKEEYYTQEASFYWRVVCFYLRSNSDEGPQIVEKVLPLGKVYTEFLKKIIQKQWSLINDDSDAYMEQECLCTNVMEIASCIDLSDEFGRKSLIDMTRQFLTAPNCLTTSIEPLLKLYSVLESDQYRLCDDVVELISEIRDPQLAAEKLAQQNCMETNQDERSESAASELNSRRILSQIEEISSKINDLNDLIEHAPENYELEDLKNQRAQLEKKKIELSSVSINITNPDIAPETTNNHDSSIKDGEGPHTEEELGDYKILLRCNVMTVTVLKICKKVLQLTSCLRSLIDNLVLPSIQSFHPGVRNQAVKALGLLSLLNVDVALKYMTLFLQIVELDIDNVVTSALAAIIDCFLLFGMEPFKDIEYKDLNENRKENTTNGNEGDGDLIDSKHSRRRCRHAKTLEDDSDEDETLTEAVSSQSKSDELWATKLLSVFIEHLDNPSAEIRTVCGKGLAKLMLHSRVTSPKLLSRLILLWFNPLTEDDVSLLHLLSNFLNIFASSSLEKQQMIGQAVLPTLKTLFKAPASSPLSEVDPWNVAYLLLTLTDSIHLKKNAKSSEKEEESLENPVHDDLALILSNEIMNAPSASGVKIYVRMLCNIRLSPNNSQVIKDLLVILHPMIKKISDRTAKNMLDRLRKDLHAILEKLGLSLTPKHVPVTPKANKRQDSSICVLSKSFFGDLEEPTLIMEENSGSDQENPEDDAAMRNRKASFLNATYLSQRFKHSVNIDKPNTKMDSVGNETRPDTEEEVVDLEVQTEDEDDLSQSETAKMETDSASDSNHSVKRNLSASNSTTSTKECLENSMKAPMSVPDTRRTSRNKRQSTIPNETPTVSNSNRTRESNTVATTDSPSDTPNVRKSTRASLQTNQSVSRRLSLRKSTTN